jgi:hypothetical protein
MLVLVQRRRPQFHGWYNFLGVRVRSCTRAILSKLEHRFRLAGNQGKCSEWQSASFFTIDTEPPVRTLPSTLNDFMSTKSAYPAALRGHDFERDEVSLRLVHN